MALEYIDPRDAIKKLYRRNIKELRQYSTLVKLPVSYGHAGTLEGENVQETPPCGDNLSPHGGEIDSKTGHAGTLEGYDDDENKAAIAEINPEGETRLRSVRIFNEEGVMILTMLSSQPKAAEFRAWAVKILKAYRHGNLVLANPLAREHLLETCIKESRFGSPAAVHVLIEHFGFPATLRRDINRDLIRRASRLPAKEPELLDWFLDTFLPRLRDEIEGTPGEILAGIRNRPPYYTNWGEMAVEGALWCLRHRPSDLFTFVCPLAEAEGVETDISSQLFTRWLSYNSARLKSGGWARVEHSRTQGWNVFRLMLVDGTGVHHG